MHPDDEEHFRRRDERQAKMTRNMETLLASGEASDLLLKHPGRGPGSLPCTTGWAFNSVTPKARQFLPI